MKRNGGYGNVKLFPATADRKQDVSSTNSILITVNSQEGKEDNRIVLNVKSAGYGDEADQYSYSIGRDTPLDCLMLDFFKRIGVTYNTVRFRYKGQIIIYRGFSPKKLQMEEGDTIQVIACERFRPISATQSTLITLPLVANGEKPIILQVKDLRHNSLLYSIGRNTPIENLLLDYADRICEFYENIEFIHKGHCIDPGKTANELGLEDRDIIFQTLHTYS